MGLTFVPFAFGVTPAVTLYWLVCCAKATATTTSATPSAAARTATLPILLVLRIINDLLSLFCVYLPQLGFADAVAVAPLSGVKVTTTGRLLPLHLTDS